MVPSSYKPKKAWDSSGVRDESLETCREIFGKLRPLAGVQMVRAAGQSGEEMVGVKQSPEDW